MSDEGQPTHRDKVAQAAASVCSAINDLGDAARMAAAQGLPRDVSQIEALRDKARSLFGDIYRLQGRIRIY